MEFRYRYSIKPSDIWQVRMYYAYTSYLAAVNLVCIFASIVLIVTQWENAGGVFRAIMLVFLSLFLVIQPLVLYINAVAQAKGHQEEIELVFAEAGLTIRIGEKTEKHPWSKLTSLAIKPTLVIVYIGAGSGYILTNRVLKDTRKEFISFVKEHIRAEA